MGKYDTSEAVLQADCLECLLADEMNDLILLAETHEVARRCMIRLRLAMKCLDKLKEAMASAEITGTCYWDPIFVEALCPPMEVS